MSFRLRVVCALVLAISALSTPPAHAADHERVPDGSFESGKAGWWSSGNTPSKVENGMLCASVPGGTVNAWDSMIGLDRIPFELGQPYKLSFKAKASRNVTIRALGQLKVAPYTAELAGYRQVTTELGGFEVSGTAKAATADGQVLFQLGGTGEAYTICLDDISLTGGVIAPGHSAIGSSVRVNQVGYLVDGPKRATIVNAATQPLTWRLLDEAGKPVVDEEGRPVTGETGVYGRDVMSGDHVHTATFDQVTTPGTYRLAVGVDQSAPFKIATRLYGKLRTDALAYFYHNRSGIKIDEQYVGDAYDRDPAHLAALPRGDGAQWGGWYDAGDHGKYVVNGALAAWQLIDAYEQSGDVNLSIPETGGALPDILDEAKWELSWMLRMQRADGMVHHKIHDIGGWTGLPTDPAKDPKDRELFDVSTAATLNLAAVGARCARVYRAFDTAFARICLDAAVKAWNAAKQNPAIYAPQVNAAGKEGGGTYSDTDVSDEFSWAAAELYTITGKSVYRESIKHRLYGAWFSWRDTGPLADLALSRVHYIHPLVDDAASPVVTNPDYDAARTRIVNGANEHLADQYAQGYPNPDLPKGRAGLPAERDSGLPTQRRYGWGSTATTASRALLMGYAHAITHEAKYRDGALEALDYILGRNALNQSYVTGYGTRFSQNQHHRFWAYQKNHAFPHPPPGALAGGPNSDLSPTCAPAKCYLDDIDSYSTNEVTISWNSALAWLAAFADDSTV